MSDTLLPGAARPVVGARARDAWRAGLAALAAFAARPYRHGPFRTRAELWSLALRSFLSAIGIVGPLMFLAGNWNRRDWQRDSVPVYLAVQRIHDGAPLYTPWTGHGPIAAGSDGAYPAERMPYPPFLPAVLEGAAGLGYVGFTRLLYLLVLLGTLVYGASLAWIVTGRLRLLEALAGVGAIFVVPGAMSALSMANVEPLLWAFYGLAFALPAFRGAGFASSGLVKLYGIWPLLFALRRAPRRVLASAAAACATAVVVGAAVLGVPGLLRALVDWIRWVLPAASQGYLHDGNLSLSMLPLEVARRLGWWHYASGPLAAAPRLWLLLAGVGAPLVAGYATRTRPLRVQCVVVLCAAIAFSPMFWPYSRPVFLLPVALWLGRRARAAGVAELPSDAGEAAHDVRAA